MAGKRARLSGERSRLQELIARIESDLAETQARLATLQARYSLVTPRLALLEQELAAVDKAIERFDTKAVPGLIADIQAWQGRYGARGGLNDAIRQILQAASPSFLSTLALYNELADRFPDGIPSSPTERRRWIAGNLRRRLQEMVAEGLVERRIGAFENGRRQACWRWAIPRPPTMAELRTKAAAVHARRKGNA
jgi:hypothetical protein